MVWAPRLAELRASLQALLREPLPLLLVASTRRAVEPLLGRLNFLFCILVILMRPPKPFPRRRPQPRQRQFFKSKMALRKVLRQRPTSFPLFMPPRVSPPKRSGPQRTPSPRQAALVFSRAAGRGARRMLSSLLLHPHCVDFTPTSALLGRVDRT